MKITTILNQQEMFVFLFEPLDCNDRQLITCWLGNYLFLFCLPTFLISMIVTKLTQEIVTFHNY